jgi:hypothetical protein
MLILLVLGASTFQAVAQYHNITIVLWQIQHFSGPILFYFEDSTSKIRLFHNIQIGSLFSLHKKVFFESFFFLKFSTFLKIMQLVLKAVKCATAVGK